jgi:hypothetical protein
MDRADCLEPRTGAWWAVIVSATTGGSDRQDGNQGQQPSQGEYRRAARRHLNQ